jgi:hypothetical protein
MMDCRKICQEGYIQSFNWQQKIAGAEFLAVIQHKRVV